MINEMSEKPQDDIFRAKVLFSNQDNDDPNFDNPFNYNQRANVRQSFQMDERRKSLLYSGKSDLESVIEVSKGNLTNETGERHASTLDQ